MPSVHSFMRSRLILSTVRRTRMAFVRVVTSVAIGTLRATSVPTIWLAFVVLDRLAH
jgi:hypothetical protein